MDKDLIIKIFNNKILNKIIFNHIHSIHKNNYRIKDINIYKWEQLGDEPETMAKLNMFGSIKKYYSSEKNKIVKPKDILDHHCSIYTEIFCKDRLYVNKMSTAHLVIIKSLFNGNIELLKFMLEEVVGEQNMVFYICMEKGGGLLMSETVKTKSMTMEILDYLYSLYQRHYQLKGIVNYFDLYIQSPFCGKFDIVKWFDSKCISASDMENKSYSVNNMCSLAIKSGSAETLQWLLHNNTKELDIRMDWWDAVSSGSVDLLNFMISTPVFQKSFKSDYYFRLGVSFGNKHVIEWLYKQDCTIPSCSTKFHVYETDNPDFIEWIFHFFKSIGVEDVMEFNNVIDWYIYYIKEICISKKDFICNTLDYSIINGHINIMKWLHSNQVSQSLTPAFLLKAHYLHGNLELLQWLYENRTERCTDIFNEFGNVSSYIQLFIVDHYPDLLPTDVLEQCPKFKCELFIKIITKYPQFIQLGSLVIASSWHDFDVFKIIHSKLSKDYLRQSNNTSSINIGKAQQESVLKLIKRGDLEMLQYLFENAIIPIKSTYYRQYIMDVAISKKNLNIIKYLHYNTVCKLDSESVDKMNSNSNEYKFDRLFCYLKSEKKKRVIDEESDDSETFNPLKKKKQI